MKSKALITLSVTFLLLLVSASDGFAQSPPPVSFQPAVNYAAGTNTCCVTVGDFNGDGKPPLSFELNNAQTDPRVKFLSRGSGYTLFLTGNEAVLAFRKAGDTSQKLEVRS
jgi:hypothetical protein